MAGYVTTFGGVSMKVLNRGGFARWVGGDPIITDILIPGGTVSVEQIGPRRMRSLTFTVEVVSQTDLEALHAVKGTTGSLANYPYTSGGSTYTNCRLDIVDDSVQPAGPNSVRTFAKVVFKHKPVP